MFCLKVFTERLCFLNVLPQNHSDFIIIWFDKTCVFCQSFNILFLEGHV